MKIYLHERHFNPLFYELKKYTDRKEVDTILVYGGKSSSKTYSICEYHIIELLKGKSTFSLRKEGSRIQSTLQRTYSKVVDQIAIRPVIEEVAFKFRGKDNSEIKLTGLDSESKIKGIEDYNYLYFDELDHFTKDEFEQGQASLRGQEGQKVFASWNPVSENIWIKKDYIDNIEWNSQEHKLPSPDSFVKLSKDGHTVLIKTDYRDNYWIVGHPSGEDRYGFRDDRIIRRYEDYKVKDPLFYKVNVIGEWGLIKNDSPLFYNYTRKYHIGKTGAPNKSYPLRISFDFNIGSTYCIIYQFIPKKRENGGGIFIYKTMKGNDTKDLCRLLREYFGWKNGARWGGTRNIMITGDSTGKNRNAVAGNTNNYKIILNELKLSRSHLYDVSGVNQRHVHSQTLCNDVLVSIPLTINKDTNGDLIYDLETAQMTDDSTIKKDRKDNPQDAGDCFRYAINQMFPSGIDDVDKYSVRIDPNYMNEFR